MWLVKRKALISKGSRFGAGHSLKGAYNLARGTRPGWGIQNVFKAESLAQKVSVSRFGSEMLCKAFSLVIEFSTGTLGDAQG
jgi:hypothetical protein